MSREVEAGRFAARSDAGRIFTIIEYQAYATKPNEPNVEVPGPKRFTTLTGQRVDQVDSETYMIVDNKIVLRKVL